MEQEAELRSYWRRWSKQDFFPEPTFQNFTSYLEALSNTPSRLKDRFLNRSTDSFELLHLPKQSENHMKRCLSWWDLVWLSFGSVVGSGIFVITGQATLQAGPAIVLSYAISGLSALLSVLCYTEFAVEIPVAGGSFSYLRIELGDFVAFIAAGNILLEAVVGAAGVGRSWSSYFASIINTNTNLLRFSVQSLPHGFNLLDPIAVVVILVANVITVSGTSRTSMLNWIDRLDLVVVEDGAMPELKKLTLSRCQNLKLLPFGIGSLVFLEELLLYDMPEEFIAKLRQDSEDHYLVENIRVIQSFYNGSTGCQNLS